MILLIEPDLIIRKRLSDLLNRERIIGKSMLTEAVEILCRYKNEINLIIANVQVLSDEVTRQAISQMCKKLSFKAPPILGFYTKHDTEQVQDFKKISKNYRLINYDEKDPGFPVEYLQVVSELFPQLNCDSAQAIKTWTEEKNCDDIAELHEWLKDEGIKLDEPAIVNAGNAVKTPDNLVKDIKDTELVKSNPGSTQRPDFEKMYYDLKKKYDALYTMMQELTNALKNKDTDE